MIFIYSFLNFFIIYLGTKCDWNQKSDLVKNPDGNDINPCGEFQWSPEGPVSQIHTPRLLAGAPGIFSDFLRSVQMRKGEWGTESKGSYRTYKSLEKLQTDKWTVWRYEKEGWEEGRVENAEFVVKYLLFGRTLWLIEFQKWNIYLKENQKHTERDREK